ncbi:MAG: outer membrane lipid asymmetry maintenance protein MlaD [Proteobacteria bacterium]|nr:outer membrane lipid asymmetry maintenance protein MlaD [Pseudomonadota bacterium]
MKKNVLETIIGALVLLVAASFVYTAYSSSRIHANSDGYSLVARFDKVDGLALGSDVRMSGLKVGIVTGEEIDPQTYRAVITLNVDNKLKLPKDSTAAVSSDGLLGGKFLSLIPGAEEEMLKNGEEIQFTQSSVNLEELIGKFIFGSAEEKEKKDKDKAQPDNINKPDPINGAE